MMCTLNLTVYTHSFSIVVKSLKNMILRSPLVVSLSVDDLL